jgi:hypothetical protein
VLALLLGAVPAARALETREHIEPPAFTVTFEPRHVAAGADGFWTLQSGGDAGNALVRYSSALQPIAIARGIDDPGAELFALADGGVVTIRSVDGYGPHCYIRRYDAGGAPVWAREYPRRCAAYDAAADGGAWLVLSGDPPLFVRIAPDGEPRTLPPAADLGLSGFEGIAADRDRDRVYAVGFARGQSTSALVVAVDANGTIAWSRALPFAATTRVRVAAGTDGGIYAAGATPSPYSFWRVRLDRGGAIAWSGAEPPGSTSFVDTLVAAPGGGMIALVDETPQHLYAYDAAGHATASFAPEACTGVDGCYLAAATGGEYWLFATRSPRELLRYRRDGSVRSRVATGDGGLYDFTALADDSVLLVQASTLNGTDTRFKRYDAAGTALATPASTLADGGQLFASATENGDTVLLTADAYPLFRNFRSPANTGYFVTRLRGADVVWRRRVEGVWYSTPSIALSRDRVCVAGTLRAPGGDGQRRIDCYGRDDGAPRASHVLPDSAGTSTTTAPVSLRVFDDGAIVAAYAETTGGALRLASVTPAGVLTTQRVTGSYASPSATFNAAGEALVVDSSSVTPSVTRLRADGSIGFQFGGAPSARLLDDGTALVLRDRGENLSLERLRADGSAAWRADVPGGGTYSRFDFDATSV